MIQNDVPDPPAATGSDEPTVARLADDAANPTDKQIAVGLRAHDDGSHSLTPGVIGFRATALNLSALTDLIKPLPGPPHLLTDADGGRIALFRLTDASLMPTLAKAMPDRVTLVREGASMVLGNAAPFNLMARAIDELPELTSADISFEAAVADDPDDGADKPTPQPIVANNRLRRYSLQGRSEEYRRLAVEARPLLGQVCMSGQFSLWYAAPGTGKTLIALRLVVDAVHEGRINAQNVFYINADDNSEGFATKMQLMDDIGAHVLAPGVRGLERTEFLAHLERMAEADEAHGVLIVIDTLKKFADIMDKKRASVAGQALRAVAMKGGTVLALAHTAKNPNKDGSVRYAGTTDFMEDADAAFTIKALRGVGDSSERVVEFTCEKSRGGCADRAVYAFTAEQGVKWEDMLASVRLLDNEQADEFKRIETQLSDAEIIAGVSTAITAGINVKMQLMKEVSTRLNVSGRAVTRVIERYSGDDPAQHRWRFRRAARGAQVFELLPPPA